LLAAILVIVYIVLWMLIKPGLHGDSGGTSCVSVVISAVCAVSLPVVERVEPVTLLYNPAVVVLRGLVSSSRTPPGLHVLAEAVLPHGLDPLPVSLDLVPM